MLSKEKSLMKKDCFNYLIKGVGFTKGLIQKTLKGFTFIKEEHEKFICVSWNFALGEQFQNALDKQNKNNPNFFLPTKISRILKFYEILPKNVKPKTNKLIKFTNQHLFRHPVPKSDCLAAWPDFGHFHQLLCNGNGLWPVNFFKNLNIF